MSKFSLPPNKFGSPPAGIDTEVCSVQILHRALLTIEEQLQLMQGEVRNLLWEETVRGATSCQFQLDQLTRLIGEWEMAAIRTQWELEIAEGRSRPD